MPFLQASLGSVTEAASSGNPWIENADHIPRLPATYLKTKIRRPLAARLPSVAVVTCDRGPRKAQPAASQSNNSAIKIAYTLMIIKPLLRIGFVRTKTVPAEGADGDLTFREDAAGTPDRILDQGSCRSRPAHNSGQKNSLYLNDAEWLN